MKKFYFMLAALLVSFAASATDFYMIGGFNKWAIADANAKFTETADGVYTLEYQGTLTSGFKINDGTWSNDEANFGSNGSALVVGEPYTYGIGGSTGDITMAGNVENPTVILNLNDQTLLVKGQEAEAETIYAIHGNLDGGQDWYDNDMTESNGLWILSDADCAAGTAFGIKVKDKSTDSQTGWFAAAGDTVISAGETYAVKANGSNWSIPVAGTYTFTFDPEAMTLKVTAGSDGIADVVAAEEEVPAVYYNMQGQRVVAPAEGLYIEVRGDKARKVVL